MKKTRDENKRMMKTRQSNVADFQRLSMSKLNERKLRAHFRLRMGLNYQ